MSLQQILMATGGATGPPFSPSDIAGLTLWLKADAIVGLANNDPVSSWPDSSGNGYDGIQPSGSLQPLYQTNAVNGLPAVYFDQSAVLTTNTMSSGIKPVSCFAVFNVTDVGSYRAILGSTNPSGIEWRIDQATAQQSFLKQGAANIGTSTGAVSVGSWTSAGITYTNTGGFAFYTDNVADNSGTNNQTFTSSVVLIGAQDAGSSSEPFWGSIAEIIEYDSAITGTDLTNLLGYFATKYGV